MLSYRAARKRSHLQHAARPVLDTLEKRVLLSASLFQGTLNIVGTRQADDIVIRLDELDPQRLVVDVNGRQKSYEVSGVRAINVVARDGDDVVEMDQTNGSITIPTIMHGGRGNDTLVGGDGKNFLIGGDGDDLLIGGASRDRIWGNAGNDRILGNGGHDRIVGGRGDDIINSGWGPDMVRAGRGDNRVDIGNGGIAVPHAYSGNYRFQGVPIRNAASFAPVGYVPAQVRAGYGFGDLSDATFTNRGAGQAIIIIIAGRVPNAQADLDKFAEEFELPPADLEVIAADGTMPRLNDPLWVGEANLDLQWAHAIAPLAKKVLILADTALPNDMMEAVDRAVKYCNNESPGGVVSMSWGIFEEYALFDVSDLPGAPRTEDYLEWNTHFDGSLSLDAGDDFDTTYVSFVAAAGDEGDLISFPATSPNVLAVGGTTLALDADGNRGDETVWRDGGGGMVSLAFPRPTYQDGVTHNGDLLPMRGVPDVAYNGDPATGVAVYCSDPRVFQGPGWGQLGGTSAGAAQWAALVALSNELLAAEFQPTIGKELVSQIYYLGTFNQGRYFNDIVSGSTRDWTLFPNGIPTPTGFTASVATAGWDISSGFGSPKADQLIPALAGQVAGNMNFRANFVDALTLPHVNTRAVVNFWGIGNYRFTSTNNKVRMALLVRQDNGGFALVTVDKMKRKGADMMQLRGTGTATASSETQVGTFQLVFRGKIVRVHKVERISGRFYAVDPVTGKELTQGSVPLFLGTFRG